MYSKLSQFNPLVDNHHVFVQVLCILAYIELNSIRCLLYFQSSTVSIFKYKWKYLLRRILHASHGSSNPYVIKQLNVSKMQRVLSSDNQTSG